MTFEYAIYLLGASTLAVSVAHLTFAAVDAIEKPRHLYKRCRKCYHTSTHRKEVA